MSHESANLEENQDDPVIGWTYFVAVVGILLLLVGVYFAHGIYYQTVNGDRVDKDDNGAPALYAGTIEAQKRRLERHDSWQAVSGQKDVPKKDAAGKLVVDENGVQVMTQEAVYKTVPTVALDEARSEVLNALKASQGR